MILKQSKKENIRPRYPLNSYQINLAAARNIYDAIQIINTRLSQDCNIQDTGLNNVIDYIGTVNIKNKVKYG